MRSTLHLTRRVTAALAVVVVTAAGALFTTPASPAQALSHSKQEFEFGTPQSAATGHVVTYPAEAAPSGNTFLFDTEDQWIRSSAVTPADNVPIGHVILGARAVCPGGGSASARLTLRVSDGTTTRQWGLARELTSSWQSFVVHGPWEAGRTWQFFWTPTQGSACADGGVARAELDNAWYEYGSGTVGVGPVWPGYPGMLQFGPRSLRYAGYNAFGLTGCETGIGYTEAELRSMFQGGRGATAYANFMRPGGIIRTWAHQWNDPAAIQRVLDLAVVYEQRVILSLADGMSNCEQDGALPGGADGKTDAWYRGGYHTTFKPWVRTVVDRFKSHPGVAMWEIMNEPGNHRGGAANSTLTDTEMKAFIDDIAATIDDIDPGTLVTTGTLSADMVGTGDLSYVTSGPDIDVGSVHEYDYDWEQSPGVYADTIVSGWVTSAQAEMRSIGKPLIVGESGVSSGEGCRTTPAARAGVIGRKLDAYLPAAGTNGIAGVNVWSLIKTPYTCTSPNGSGIPAGNTFGAQGEYSWLQFDDPATTTINNKQYALYPSKMRSCAYETC